MMAPKLNPPDGYLGIEEATAYLNNIGKTRPNGNRFTKQWLAQPAHIAEGPQVSFTGLNRLYKREHLDRYDPEDQTTWNVLDANRKPHKGGRRASRQVATMSSAQTTTERAERAWRAALEKLAGTSRTAAHVTLMEILPSYTSQAATRWVAIGKLAGLLFGKGNTEG